MITISGSIIFRQLHHEIHAADYFSLIANETTDILHNVQMYIAIHWVDSSYTIQEAAIGLVLLTDMTVMTLFHIINDVLVRCSLPIDHCIDKAYDGRLNMSGI